MADPKPPSGPEELTPEQRKFLEEKQQQTTKATAVGAEYRSDQGQYLKSGRQQKAETKAAKARPKAEPVSRREFMNYAWGAALGLVLIQGGVAAFAFALPRFKEGEFGGVFDLGPATSLPPVDAPPVNNVDGQFWVSNDADGVRALYRVCTHLGCIYEWKDQTFRFECPCHGSKFQKDGKFIEGPAPRSLDQFVVILESPGGQVVAQTTVGGEGLPVPSPDTVVKVDTGAKLNGPPH